MSDTTTVRVGQDSTVVISTGAIGPRGLQGDSGPQGIQGIPGPDQAVFGKDGDLTVTTGNGRWRVIGARTIFGIYISVGTAPVGADVVVDVKKNGSTLFTSATKPTIPDGSNSSSRTIPDFVDLIDGDYLTVDVDQVGSTTPGSDLTVQILFV